MVMMKLMRRCGKYRRGWNNLREEQVEQSVTLRLLCPFELMVEQ